MCCVSSNDTSNRSPSISRPSRNSLVDFRSTISAMSADPLGDDECGTEYACSTFLKIEKKFRIDEDGLNIQRSTYFEGDVGAIGNSSRSALDSDDSELRFCRVAFGTDAFRLVSLNSDLSLTAAERTEFF